MTAAAAGALNRVKAVWSQGRPALLGWLHIPSAFSAEALGRCGYDGLVVDMQHGPAGLETAVEMFRAIESGGGEPCVRLMQNDPGEIMKLLDMGATVLICPMVETAGQAAAFARALHYPPAGERSYGPRRPLLRYGADYRRLASATVAGLVMIETRKGMENLDEILAVEGLEGVFIGPADLAVSLGCDPHAPAAEPVVEDAIEAIRERCRRAGRRAGIFCADAGQAQARLRQGFDLVSLQPDLSLAVEGARRSVAAACEAIAGAKQDHSPAA